jgi:hypothetical protein
MSEVTSINPAVDSTEPNTSARDEAQRQLASVLTDLGMCQYNLELWTDRKAKAMDAARALEAKLNAAAPRT